VIPVNSIDSPGEGKKKKKKKKEAAANNLKPSNAFMCGERFPRVEHSPLIKGDGVSGSQPHTNLELVAHGFIFHQSSEQSVSAKTTKLNKHAAFRAAAILRIIEIFDCGRVVAERLVQHERALKGGTPVHANHTPIRGRANVRPPCAQV
jgi:hypothetical protein